MVNKIEINLNAIAGNLRAIKKIVGQECKIIGVVKANAYGHGLVETARAIWTCGADILAVADLDEAVQLRVAKIRSPIITLSYVEPSQFRRALDFDITFTVFDFAQAVKISQEAAKQNKWAKIDLKIDTGMNRFGFSTHDFWENYQKIGKLGHPKIVGLHSHFASASDREVSREQINRFRGVLFALQQNNISAPTVHLAATEGTFLYPEAHFDAVRIGLALYGYGGPAIDWEELEPALELKTQIAQVRRVGAGEAIGYGGTFKVKKPLKIAVLPIGYADGYPRSLSNKAEVLADGKRAKVVGRICMNVMMVDVTGLSCSVGDEVVLIGGTSADMISAQDLARWAGTIPNEILSRLSPFIPREYHFK